jgi:hypothetical protein
MMINKLIFPSLILITVLIFSCNNPKKNKVDSKSVKTSDNTIRIRYDTLTDDLAAFISGMPNGKSGCISKVDSLIKWNQFAWNMDSIFTRLGSSRFEKMKVWGDSELINNHSRTTLFYPFSGPDFLNANIFYPDADQYIMIAMEPIGSLPDICNMHPDSVSSYLSGVRNSLNDLIKRSYFITSKMNDDLRKTKVNGTVPLISLFIKRTGHHIVSINRIGIDNNGNWQPADSLKNKNGIVQGIKIDLLSLSKNKVQSVFYFRTDISDKGLEKNEAFMKYLSKLPQSHTYLKAGSYLMHYETFKIIRSVVFEKSSTILQDDSGIAYKYFDKSKWNIILYGKYSKPKDEFAFISEPDLEKAYKSSNYKPLPYTLGYNWRKGNANMLYAIKKNK